MAAPKAILEGSPRDVASPARRHRFSDADIDALKAHPQFAEACRLAALSGIELYRGNRLVNTMLTDRGRSSLSLLALYLHFSRHPGDPRSGLTISRLKSLCADQNIGSPGRIEAFVMLMRVFGLLKHVPSLADQRVRRLEPTEKLTAMLYERWSGLLAAMALVFPEAGTISAGLADEAYVRALVRQFGDRFLAGARPLDDPRARELFGDRNAGLMIAFSLMTAGGPGEFPPRKPVTVSISALARYYGVSRVHVRKLLNDATEAGYIVRLSGDEPAFEILPPLHAVVKNFFANAFMLMRDCAPNGFDKT